MQCDKMFSVFPFGFTQQTLHIFSTSGSNGTGSPGTQPMIPTEGIGTCFQVPAADQEDEQR